MREYKTPLTISAVIVVIFVIGYLFLAYFLMGGFQPSSLGADLTVNNILTDKEIGEKTIDFKWNDDNCEGEDICIISNEHNYYGFGGNWVTFLASNLSKENQNINFSVDLPSGEWKVVQLQKFTGNTVEVIKGYTTPEQVTSTTTYPEIVVKEKTITTANWEDINYDDNYLASGETGHYRADVRYPIDSSDNGLVGEFIITATGDKGSIGELDPNAWLATEDFESYSDEDDLDGATGGSGWATAWETTYTDSSFVADSAQKVEGSNSGRATAGDGHAGTLASRTFTGITSGSFTFAMRLDSGAAATVDLIKLFEGANMRHQFGVMSTPNPPEFYYYDGGEPGIKLIDFNYDTWYICELDFETGAGGWEGLAADTYNIRCKEDGGSFTEVTDKDLYAAATEIDEIQLVLSASPDAGNIYWIDDIGPVSAAPAAGATPNENIIIFE